MPPAAALLALGLLPRPSLSAFSLGLLPSAPGQVMTGRLLGMGSTARVYEGRWCGRRCAVKVLFTVEIVPEEIKRTCLEAELLHSLQVTDPLIVEVTSGDRSVMDCLDRGQAPPFGVGRAY